MLEDVYTSYVTHIYTYIYIYIYTSTCVCIGGGVAMYTVGRICEVRLEALPSAHIIGVSLLTGYQDQTGRRRRKKCAH